MPCASIAARISSPTGPSSTVRMCSSERNRNGSAGDDASRARCCSAAPTLMRIMSSPPIFSCSIVSRSVPERAVREDLDAQLAAGLLLASSLPM